MVTTLWVLMSLTIWMGEELVVDAVNAYPTEKECRTALEQRARQVAALLRRRREPSMYPVVGARTQTPYRTIHANRTAWA